MRILKIIRIICLVPLAAYLLSCIISMFTGVNNALFGVQTKHYGFEAFMWMAIAQIAKFWWLYGLCIVGIIVTSILIRLQ